MFRKRKEIQKEKDIKTLIEIADAYVNKDHSAYHILNRDDPAAFPSSTLKSLTILLYVITNKACYLTQEGMSKDLYKSLIDYCSYGTIPGSQDFQIKADLTQAAILCIKGFQVDGSFLDRLEDTHGTEQFKNDGILKKIRQDNSKGGPWEAVNLKYLGQHYVKPFPESSVIKLVDATFEDTIESLRTQVLTFVNLEDTDWDYPRFKDWAGEVLSETKKRLESRADVDAEWLHCLNKFKYALSESDKSSSAMIYQAVGGVGEFKETKPTVGQSLQPEVPVSSEINKEAAAPFEPTPVDSDDRTRTFALTRQSM